MEYKTGIVFSGGGVRGFAHAGALKALQEFGIYPDAISGVSAGAIAGALYADGYTPDEMLDIFIDLDLYKLLKFRGFGMGLLNPDGLRRVLNNNLKAKRFEDLRLSLTIGCTNIDLGETVFFQEGLLLDPLMASVAFPFLIKPQMINGHHYVDGGLMNNLPVQPLVGHCNKIIGVYVNPLHFGEKFKGTRSYIDHVIHLGLRANMLSHIGSCDLFIEPPDLSGFHLLKISSARDIFKKGYEYTLHFLKAQTDLSPYRQG